MSIASFVASCGCAAAPVAADDARCATTHVSTPTLDRVAAQVWRVRAARAEPSAANGGVIAQLVIVRDRDRVWLIGAGPTPAFGAALACVIARDVGHAVTDVVVTRAAAPLAMGSIAFGLARRWATDGVMRTMRARCEQCRAQLAASLGAAGESLVPQAVRIPDRMIGRVGARTGRLGPFDWRVVRRGPGEETLVLRAHAARVVIAQGLLWGQGVPDLRGTHSDAMARSLRVLRVVAGDAIVLGECGEPAGVAEIDAHLRYIDTLRDEIARRLERGDPSAENRLPLPAYGALADYERLHPLNVQRVWREREGELLR